MNDIDYNLLRMLPQDQAMAYLREKLAGGMGDYVSGDNGGYYSNLGSGVSVIPGYEGYVHMTEVDAPAPDARRNYTAVIPSGQEGRAYLAEFGPEGKLNAVGQQPALDWYENEVFGVPLGAYLPLAAAAAGAYFPGTEVAAEGTMVPGIEAAEGVVSGGPGLDTVANQAFIPPGAEPAVYGIEAQGSLTPLQTIQNAGYSVGNALNQAIGATPLAAPSALTKAGSWLVDKATDPKTLATLAMTVAGGGSGQPTASTGTAGPGRTPAQQEVFDRKPRSWDWDQLQRDAAAAGMTLPQYMARNWNRVSTGGYNKPLAMAGGGAVPGMPCGGLGQVARLARGGGSGRADTIPARLSDGEYVIDAETVALLGDGSTDEGARRLDAMRQQVRAHKGRALAAGKFSPDAKAPAAYMKGRK